MTFHFRESCWIDLWIFFHHPLSKTRSLLQSHPFQIPGWKSVLVLALIQVFSLGHLTSVGTFIVVQSLSHV